MLRLYSCYELCYVALSCLNRLCVFYFTVFDVFVYVFVYCACLFCFWLFVVYLVLFGFVLLDLFCLCFFVGCDC